MKTQSYARFDDDICYMTDDALANLRRFREENTEPFLVLGNIVNNAVCFLFSPTSRFDSDIVGRGWQRMHGRSWLAAVVPLVGGYITGSSGMSSVVCKPAGRMSQSKLMGRADSRSMRLVGWAEIFVGYLNWKSTKLRKSRFLRRNCQHDCGVPTSCVARHFFLTSHSTRNAITSRGRRPISWLAIEQFREKSSCPDAKDVPCSWGPYEHLRRGSVAAFYGVRDWNRRRAA